LTTLINKIYTKKEKEKCLFTHIFAVRFLFILDSNAPEFENNKSFYTRQLSKDLTVNIYKNGGWGYYKRIAVENSKNHTKITESLVFKNFSSSNR